MLNFLHIENVAVIKSADIEFEGGFCVFTGRTGAGKSIITDALGLLAGARSDKDLIRTGEKRAVAQGVFDADERSVKLLAEYGIESEDDEIFLSRSIAEDGKSRSMINGQPVPLSVMKAVGGELIKINGQQSASTLRSEAEQLLLLDNCADNFEILEEYISQRKKCREAYKKYEEIKNLEENAAREAENAEFMLNELESADVKKGEEDGLNSQRKLLANSEKINTLCSRAYNSLLGGQNNAYELCSEAFDALESLADIIPECEETAKRVQSSIYELQDAAQTAMQYCSDEDPTEKLDEIESRLAQIAGLRKKYNTDADGLCDLKEEIKKKLENIFSAGEQAEKAKKEAKAEEKKLKECAEKLTQSRKKAAVKFEKEVVNGLCELDMPKTKFSVRFFESEYTETGADRIEFYISANAGEDEKPLAKIASGGELSRIMLAIKSASSQERQTVVFDEIDAGVSGSTGSKIGRKLKSFADKFDCRVLCVTHSAQLAAFADSHYLTEKLTPDKRTVTRVTKLDRDGRINELSRIISGEEITPAAMKAAEELLDFDK